MSALALERDGRLVLLDCGEAAQLQLLRAELRPTSRLDGVLVTHLHGDHVNGLPGLLGTMSLEGRERALTVAGPRGLAAYLEALGRAGVLNVGFPLELVELSAPEEKFAVGGWSVTALPLDHRILTYGFALDEPARPGTLDLGAALAAGVPSGPLLGQLKAGQPVTLADGRVVRPEGLVSPPHPGRRLAYVTDTRPCDAGVALGAGAALLVHEATYPHARAADARARGHATSRQAAGIAARAKAARLVLTHVSPSADPAELLAEARDVFPATELAADLAEIAL